MRTINDSAWLNDGCLGAEDAEGGGRWQGGGGGLLTLWVKNQANTMETRAIIEIER